MRQGAISAYGASSGAYSGSVTGELQGHIDVTTVRMYNESLQQVESSTFYSAEQFLDEQYQIQIDIMEQAIDVFTDAAVEISVAVEVNELAVAATTNEEKQEVANVIAENDFTIDEQDVIVYNDSLDTIEESASTAAVILTARSDENFTTMLDDFVEYHDVMMSDATIDWNTMTYEGTMLWDVYMDGQMQQIGGPLDPYMFGGYVLSTEEMLTMGQAELNYECETGVIPGYEYLCQ